MKTQFEKFFDQSTLGFSVMTADKPLRLDDLSEGPAQLDSVAASALHSMRLTRVNAAMLNHYGAKAEDLLGRTPADFFAEDSEKGQAIFRELIEEGIAHAVTREKSLEGHYLTIEADYSFEYDPEGRVTGCFRIQRDITQRAEIESTLRANDERFKNILRSVDTVAVQGYGMDGIVHYWNDASAKLYGYTSAEALGRNLLDLIIPPEAKDAVSAEIQKMDETGESIPSSELVLQRKDGSLIPVFSSHVLVEVPGRPREFFCLDVDLTRRKEVEDALRLSMQEAQSASRAKSEFLGTMSHELRTPMNGVLGMLELLEMTTLDAEQLSCTSVIRSSSEALIEIMSDILEFSQAEAGKIRLERAILDPRKLLETLLANFSPQASAKGLKLRAELDERLPNSVMGDAKRLRQVLTHLIGNAIKFTEAGEVMVKAKVKSVEEDKSELSFEVEDTGPGLSASMKDSVFEQFTQVDGSMTRKHGGVGLGLAIAKQMVELMGGSIKVESELGRGACFSFTVKFNEPNSRELGSDSSGPATAPPPIAGQRLLLVEDNSINQKVIIGQLGGSDFNVDAVSNGQEALEALERSEYDLILMDLQMPVMDGWTAARAIREREEAAGLPRCPIIALSAHVMEKDRKACLAAGMDGHLSKPIRSGPLKAAVLSALNKN